MAVLIGEPFIEPFLVRVRTLCGFQLETKEMIVNVRNFRKHHRVHPSIYIDGTTVEKVESFKFLGVYITDKLKWTTHTDSVVKKSQQIIFNLRRLKTFGLSPKTLRSFYRC